MTRTQILGSDATSRREMLKLAGGCAALTNTSLLSTLFSLSATNCAVGQVGGLTDYKALVCVFLFGGNDSFNMLSPLTAGERDDYVDSRGGLYTDGNGGLALPTSELHSIVDGPSARTFGIHQSMPELKDLYDNGKLTFLCNIGSLVEPTTMQEYQARSNLPLGLFSHSDLQRHWMTSVPQSRSQITGWAGRMADLVTGATNTNENISMNIALNEVNMLQTGGSVVPYIIRDTGAREVSWYNAGNRQQRIFTTLTDDVLSRSYQNLLERTFAEMNRTALDAAIEFNDAIAAFSSVDSYFPAENDDTTREPTRLDRQMRIIAKSIAANEVLGQNRQVFFVGVGGWDNHDELIMNQQNNLQIVAQALKSFQDAMDGLGMTDNVTTFTASDFARTLTTNGRGSDHAWGGNQLVMGGSVVGGQIHGDYPGSLAKGNPLDVGRGRLLPTLSVDEMAAELAMWYGVPNDNNMVEILPNIRNFFGPGTDKPIGFLT